MRILIVLVLLLAACSSSGSVTPGLPSLSPQHGTVVRCESQHASATELARAGRIVTDRLRRAGYSHTTVATTGMSLIFGFPSTVSASVARGFCRTGLLDFRPVLAPPQTVTCGSTCDPDPFGTLVKRQPSFRPPSTDTQYAGLPPATQQAVAHALGTYACHVSGKREEPTGYAIACSADDLVYLLGPAVVAGTQIAGAKAIAPGANNPVWTVEISLDAAGSSAWAAWTTAHNTNNQAATDITTCSPTSAPCSDFVGFVLDGLVLSAPVTISPITGGATQISGNFTRASATTLADSLDAGALPVDLTVTSVTTK